MKRYVISIVGGEVKVGKNIIIWDYIPIGEPGLVEIKTDFLISGEESLITTYHSINKVTAKG